MEGSDETGVMQRIQSSFTNCSPSIPNHHKQMGSGGGSTNMINGQLQNLSVLEVNNSGVSSNCSVKRPVGIPPIGPKLGSQSPNLGNSSFGTGPIHSRSLSQPSVFSFDHLPPLSPSSFRDCSPNSGSNGVCLEEKGGSLGAVPGSGVTAVNVSDGLPPRRGHRRSCSDIPSGFISVGPPQFVSSGNVGVVASRDKPAQLVLKREGDRGGEGGGERKVEGEMVDDLFTAYMNLDNIDALNSSSMEDRDMDSRASGTRTNESSENEVESSSIAGNCHGVHGGSSAESQERGKRRASGDIAPASRHYRSLSMDSFMGNMNFSDESPKLPPSPGIRSTQHSPSNSFDGDNSNFSLEFGGGEFSAAEMKKIMANEKLAELAMADPKRVRRILANRQSAARSKERKLRYIAELEHKVQTLQTEATTLSAQLTLLQRDSTGIASQNNELRFRLQAMEQQAQLRDALNEALTAEVQRLKLAAAEQRGEAVSSGLPQQMFQMHPSQYNNIYQLQQQQHQNNQKQHQSSQQSQTAKPQQDAEGTKS